jgi:hypothetical protein
MRNQIGRSPRNGSHPHSGDDPGSSLLGEACGGIVVSDRSRLTKPLTHDWSQLCRAHLIRELTASISFGAELLNCSYSCLAIGNATDAE